MGAGQLSLDRLREEGAQRAWLWSAFAAVPLELSQLIVFTRVTDVTDIFTAWLGASIGVVMARPRARDRPANYARLVNRQTYLGLLGFGLWALILA